MIRKVIKNICLIGFIAVVVVTTVTFAMWLWSREFSLVDATYMLLIFGLLFSMSFSPLCAIALLYYAGFWQQEDQKGTVNEI